MGDCDSVQNAVADTPARPRAPPPFAVKDSEYDWDEDVPELPLPAQSTRASPVHAVENHATCPSDEGLPPTPFAARVETTDCSLPIDASARGTTDRESPEPLGKNTRTVSIPVYSVAGRRVPVRDMLVEKTRSMGANANSTRRLLRRVANVDADGMMSRGGAKSVLRSFNLEASDDVVDGLFCKFKRDDVTGSVPFLEFASWAMPDEQCAATEVGPGTLSGMRRPATAKNYLDYSNGTSTSRPSTASGTASAGVLLRSTSSTHLSVHDAEVLLRKKMREKFGGSGHAQKRAFQSIDLDDDGFISEVEFGNLLKRFFINVSPDGVDELFRIFTKGEQRGISFDTFVSHFGEGDAGTSTSGYDAIQSAKDARSKAQNKFTAGFEKLEAAFARTRRRAHKKANTRAHASMLDKGITMPSKSPEPALNLLEVRAALGEDSDPALVRKLKNVADDDANGLISRSMARLVSKKHQLHIADAAEKEYMRDFNDGFGRDLLDVGARGSSLIGATARGARVGAPAMAMNPTAGFRGKFGKPSGVHSVNCVEIALREKLEQRGVSTSERTFRLLFDKSNVGYIDFDSLSRVLHEFNVPVTEGEVNALLAKYDTSGSGKIKIKDFCAKMLASDFPTEVNRKVRNIDAIVSTFYRDLCDALGKVDTSGDGAFVHRRDALSCAAKAAKSASARLSASAAKAAADEASDFGHANTADLIGCTTFVAHCQRAVRHAEEVLLSNVTVKEPTGFEALGWEHYVPVVAQTPPPFQHKMDHVKVLKLARDKFSDKVPSKGVSETKMCIVLFDPGRKGFVTFETFQRGLKNLGLGSVDQATLRAGFESVTSQTKNGSKGSSNTSSFVRAFLPPRIAMDRPEKRDIVSALVRSNAVTESDVREVLAACDVAVDDAAVARLVRLSRRNPGLGKQSPGYANGLDYHLDYQKLAGMVAKPEFVEKKTGSPTPKVNHCEVEKWQVAEVSPPQTPPFPPTPD